ncbi:hypothetical protein EYF80_021001 [Liparis tanakae]|uniref:Uncharacterized protein n=1 Tax=Liparis tanakae TaxID=230148 RepID=A0A4Z2HV28_9TELE|nr:hypothetical protein EYF80_021001 [Liparis tanakae]
MTSCRCCWARPRVSWVSLSVSSSRSLSSSMLTISCSKWVSGSEEPLWEPRWLSAVSSLMVGITSHIILSALGGERESGVRIRTTLTLEVKTLKTCIKSNGASPSASIVHRSHEELGSASPCRFDAAEMSWPAGRSALDFTLAPSQTLTGSPFSRHPLPFRPERPRLCAARPDARHMPAFSLGGRASRRTDWDTGVQQIQSSSSLFRAQTPGTRLKSSRQQEAAEP